jgi:CRP-like cAMP-binding protein
MNVTVNASSRRHLSDIAVFRDCSPREIDRIDRSCVGIQVSAGRVLCTEGEVGRECFVIVRGEAVVTIEGNEIARLGEGSIFGEMALLDGRTRTATVAAVTPMDVLVFTSGEFRALLRDAPTFTWNVTTTLASRLRLVDRSLLAVRHAPEVVAP